ncbi:MAG: DUF2871 family protein [Ornithinimicrobium sp.]|uniref:DUF2871 family protein n=1 Tax=Ornithinimicrobium sp. TaxID=1977084 RepID=UPI0026DF49A5|nr:DUF2871 family protein [Ornithinimicrobium sp.]MDO5740000.1 DUF2871 family protein [Ornithinimicrobium sp.]
MLTYLFRSAASWTAIGLAGGLGYREFTKLHDYTGFTQLALVHTHAIVWGTIFMLVLLSLAIVLPGLAGDARMRWGVHLLNGGLALTVGMLGFKGSLQVLGADWADHPGLAGVSGLGHMTLTAALVLLLLAIGRQTKALSATSLPLDVDEDAREMADPR